MTRGDKHRDMSLAPSATSTQPVAAVNDIFDDAAPRGTAPAELEMYPAAGVDGGRKKKNKRKRNKKMEKERCITVEAVLCKSACKPLERQRV